MNAPLRALATAICAAALLLSAAIAPDAAGASSRPTPATMSLHRAAQLITAERGILHAAGVDIQTVSVVGPRLIVGVAPNGTGDPARVLRQHFPDVRMAVQYQRVWSAAETGPYLPGPPWLSGMELYKLFTAGGGLYYTECTAGFNVIDPVTGRTYLTTAAHCVNTGDTVLHSLGYTAQTVGTVATRAGYGSSADVALIAPRRGRTPNTIALGNGTELAVTGYLPVTGVGAAVCKSGITTGQTCGNIVQSTAATVCYSTGCFTGQQRTYNPNVAEVAYTGDSGGPVYLYSSPTSVIAAGSLSGFEETCTAGGSGCRLDGVMYFTPIRSLQQTLGVLP